MSNKFPRPFFRAFCWTHGTFLLSILVVEGKRYENNIEEHAYLRDLKIPPFFPCYVAEEKKARISNPVKNRVLESCSYIFFTLGSKKSGCSVCLKVMNCLQVTNFKGHWQTMPDFHSSWISVKHISFFDVSPGLFTGWHSKFQLCDQVEILSTYSLEKCSKWNKKCTRNKNCAREQKMFIWVKMKFIKTQWGQSVAHYGIELSFVALYDLVGSFMALASHVWPFSS